MKGEKPMSDDDDDMGGQDIGAEEIGLAIVHHTKGVGVTLIMPRDELVDVLEAIIAAIEEKGEDLIEVGIIYSSEADPDTGSHTAIVFREEDENDNAA
jgi:hypothetical protein